LIFACVYQKNLKKATVDLFKRLDFSEQNLAGQSGVVTNFCRFAKLHKELRKAGVRLFPLNIGQCVSNVIYRVFVQTSIDMSENERDKHDLVRFLRIERRLFVVS
jgi:hypothetical protein